ncbi:HAD family phosphatase [Anaerofilum sp. BX8]|uniref:HAD family phosphatase n=1 Tax=Anaerofilum hominis TaxID=2763016 RepID=A0A923L274_9FIRM|nr:HAD family phosphatase [Anaerofilum hominis]MBC5582493.1 HAD family phosphatase [Anaerofilum hominis]
MMREVCSEKREKTGRSQDVLDAFLFDFDGVLVDTETVWSNCLYQFCKSRALPVKKEELLAYVGDGDRQVISHIARIGGMREEQILSEVRPPFQEASKELTLRPGVRSYFAYAKNEGIKLALVSNSGRDYLKRWLEQLSLESCFDCVVSRESALRPKPAPDLYWKAIELLHLERSAKMIAVEDSALGMRAAAAAGIWAAAFPNEATGSAVAALSPLCVDLAKIAPQELIRRAYEVYDGGRLQA